MRGETNDRRPSSRLTSESGRTPIGRQQLGNLSLIKRKVRRVKLEGLHIHLAPGRCPLRSLS